MFDHDRITAVKNCFDTHGRLKFDPYRTDRINETYCIIFDDDGFIHADVIEIVNYLAARDVKVLTPACPQCNHEQDMNS